MSADGRQARVERKTKETEIALHLNLDGTGASKVQTPIPFFSHMLEAWSKHGLMDLAVEAQRRRRGRHPSHRGGRRHRARSGAAGGAGRQEGHRALRDGLRPMDEALIAAAVDLSGRPFLVFNVPVPARACRNFDLDLLQEFFRAFAFNAEITLHVTMHYGHNLHHITEAVFKAVGRALAEATRINPRIADQILPSTKGRRACDCRRRAAAGGEASL